jgi:hypothetical protein
MDGETPRSEGSIMATLVEEDIVQRALLDILDPPTQTPESSTGVQHREKKKYRLKKRLLGQGLPAANAVPRSIRISVVERLSSETVSVCWSDATMGRCSEQTWRLGRARTNSFCLVTGSQIRYGDEIFRPRIQQGDLSAAHDRMILAWVVHVFISANRDGR